jgi:hypothetical protein
MTTPEERLVIPDRIDSSPTGDTDVDAYLAEAAQRLQQSTEAQRKQPDDSFSMAPVATAALFDKLDQVIGEEVQWRFRSSDTADRYQRDLSEMKKDFRASGDVCEVEAEISGDKIKTKSNLDVYVEWPEEGEEQEIILQIPSHPVVPGVLIRDNFTAHHSPNHEFQIACLTTKDFERSVYMTQAPREFNHDRHALRQWILATKVNMGMMPHDGGTVQFPAVDLFREGKANWMIGATTTSRSGPFEIEDANFKHRLRMNRFGARAEAEEDATCLAACTDDYGPADILIDDRFIVWFEKVDWRGESDPRHIIQFAAYVTEDDMKEPDNLEKTDFDNM